MVRPIDRNVVTLVTGRTEGHSVGNVPITASVAVLRSANVNRLVRSFAVIQSVMLDIVTVMVVRAHHSFHNERQGHAHIVY